MPTINEDSSSGSPKEEPPILEGHHVEILPPHLWQLKHGYVRHPPIDEKGFLVLIVCNGYLTLVKPHQIRLSLWKEWNDPIDPLQA